MVPLRSSCCFAVASATLLASACSLQDFDYLKDSYHPPGGGAAGQAAGGKGGASSAGSDAGDTSTAGDSTVAQGGAVGRGGAVGQSGAVGQGGHGGAPPSSAAGEGGAPPEEPGSLLNPSFELGSGTSIPNWTSEGTTAAATVVFQEGGSGSGRLGHWLDSTAFKVATWQVVQPLPDGKYTFEIWVKRSQYLTKEYIFARDYSKSEPAAEKTADTAVGDPLVQEASYVRVVIAHIPVTSGQIKVGIYTEAGNKDNWSVIDDAALSLEP